MRPYPARRLLCLAALAALAAGAAQAAICNVPSTGYPTLAAALADPTCDPIQVAAGTLTENPAVARDVTIAGAGSGSTSIAGRVSVTGAATGVNSLRDNTTASYSTAVGAGALQAQSYDPETGPWDSHNTALGYEALSANQPGSTSTGISNTAVGSGSLENDKAGRGNTAVGKAPVTPHRNNEATGCALRM